MNTPGSGHEGIDFLLPWGLLEYLATGTFAIVWGLVWRLWRLFQRVDRLESTVKLLRDEVKQRDAHIVRLGGKLDELREELPSRQFIEGQFAAMTGSIVTLTQRIDRLYEARGGA